MEFLPSLSLARILHHSDPWGIGASVRAAFPASRPCWPGRSAGDLPEGWRRDHRSGSNVARYRPPRVADVASPISRSLPGAH